jgi:hypothetical protein
VDGNVIDFDSRLSTLVEVDPAAIRSRDDADILEKPHPINEENEGGEKRARSLSPLRDTTEDIDLVDLRGLRENLELPATPALGPEWSFQLDYACENEELKVEQKGSREGSPYVTPTKQRGRSPSAHCRKTSPGGMFELGAPATHNRGGSIGAVPPVPEVPRDDE